MARRTANGFWDGLGSAAEKVSRFAKTRTYKVTARDLERAPRKTFKIRAETSREAEDLAKKKYGTERYGDFKVANPKMRSRQANPLEELEAETRRFIEQAVNTFGFYGVLDILADEAAERSDADPNDESLELILTTLESALEEIEESATGEDEETDDDEDDADGEEDEEEEEE